MRLLFTTCIILTVISFFACHKETNTGAEAKWVHITNSRVIDSLTGEGIKDVLVQVIAFDPNVGGGVADSCRTDSTGNFTLSFKCYPQFTYKLSAYSEPNYLTGYYKPSINSDLNGIKVKMTATGRVRINVRNMAPADTFYYFSVKSNWGGNKSFYKNDFRMDTSFMFTSPADRYLKIGVVKQKTINSVPKLNQDSVFIPRFATVDYTIEY